jgi:hypothetical protein
VAFMCLEIRAPHGEPGGLEEPADELRLTAGSGFRENALARAAASPPNKEFA